LIASAQPILGTSRRFNRLAALAVAAVLAFGAGALGKPSAAHAGSNGQQIQICASVLTSFGKAFIVGPNQNGLVTASPNVWVPWTDTEFGPRCNQLKNYWWKGTVTIHWYYADGSYYRSSTCTIPVTQSSDWVSCIGPNGERGDFDSTYRG
jgi:hypothetical protein